MNFLAIKPLREICRSLEISVSWRQLRSGSQLLLGAAHHSQHLQSCQEQEAHAPMMMLTVLGANRYGHIPTQKPPAVPAILSCILCSWKLVVTEEISTGMWAVSTVSGCAERQRGAGAMAGAEITAAGLSVPELVIRFLSDDDDEGKGTGASHVPALSGNKSWNNF